MDNYFLYQHSEFNGKPGYKLSGEEAGPAVHTCCERCRHLPLQTHP